LRFQIALETPRVAAVLHEKGCDEWNQKSDEPKGQFTIYPLVFWNEWGTIGSGWPSGAYLQIVFFCRSGWFCGQDNILRR